MANRKAGNGKRILVSSLIGLLLPIAYALPAMAAVPPNDDRANAITLSDPLPITVAGDSSEATAQDPTDPIEGCAGIQQQYTVWYEYTPSDTGTIAFDISSDFGAGAAFYQVDDSGVLTQVACAGNATTIDLIGDQTYLITIGACCAGPLRGGMFNFTLFAPPPSPLEPDATYGDLGSVRVNGLAMAPRDTGTLVAYRSMGGGSGEFSVGLSEHDATGMFTGRMSGMINRASKPHVVDVVTTPELSFVVGWNRYYDGRGIEGFVAAFPKALDDYPDWGTDEFVNGDFELGLPFTGLELLTQYPFTKVTAGAVDGRGRVYIAGVIDNQVAVVRLTRSGRPDDSFGSGGLSRVPLGASSKPTDIAWGSGLVIVGQADVGGERQAFATKLTVSGDRDNRWGVYGVLMIGGPGSLSGPVQPSGSGGWFVAFRPSSLDTAGVLKASASGDIVHSFGVDGSALVACPTPTVGSGLDALSTWRTDRLLRITMALSCGSTDGTQRVAAMWRPGGEPIQALQPTGTGLFPWTTPTKSIYTTGDGQLMALIPRYLYRLG